MRPVTTQERSGWSLHEVVRDARAAGRYAEAICLANHSIDSNDAVLAGASHFEISRAWDALGCRQLAVSEVEASLAMRPEGHAGWRETCEWCMTLKARCSQCSSLTPNDAPAAH